MPNLKTVTAAGNYFMQNYASNTGVKKVGVPNVSNMTTVGTYFMSGYAGYCSKLESIAIPDTSNLTSVGSNFMSNYIQYSYVSGVPDPFWYELPAVGWFATNNVSWNAHYNLNGRTKARVRRAVDYDNWSQLVTSGKTLHTNYVRSSSDIELVEPKSTGGFLYFFQ